MGGQKMKNKKIIILLFASFMISEVLYSQNVLDGVYVKEHVPTRKVIEYSHLREADVIWSKRVWRVMVLDEKMNLPLKFPLSKSMKDRRNLMDVIHDAAIEGTLTAYKSSQHGGDDEFTTPMTAAEVLALGAKNDTVDFQDPITLAWDKKITHEELKRDKIYKFRIKEDWFFDKQRSVMDVRIIGIAPVTKLMSESGEEDMGDDELYWIYFPEARKIFVNQEVFNRGTDSERRTFDDIFFKRMFSSYIFKESNVYNRRIQDYKLNPLDALLEAQRIKTDIVNFEHDFWEY